MEQEIGTSDSVLGDNSIRTNISFQYTADGRWHTAEFSVRELPEIFASGEVDGKPICAIEMWSINSDDAPPVRMIYDFVAKVQNLNPWRVL